MFSLGRPWKTQDASGFWLKQEFDARGFPTKVCESSRTDSSPTCADGLFVRFNYPGRAGWACKSGR